MKLEYLYLVLAVLGIGYTWYYNVHWSQAVDDPTFSNFSNGAKANFTDESLVADLSVVDVTFLY